MSSSLAAALPSIQRRNSSPSFANELSPQEAELTQTSESSQDATTTTQGEGAALSGRTTWSKHPLFADKVRGLRLRAIRLFVSFRIRNFPRSTLITLCVQYLFLVLCRHGNRHCEFALLQPALGVLARSLQSSRCGMAHPGDDHVLRLLDIDHH